MSKQSFELDSQNVLSDSSVAERFAREVYVVGGGMASGLVREIHDHPIQSAQKIGTAAVTGAVLGAAATAELPAVAITAAGLAGVMTGEFVWNLIDPANPANQKRNAALQSATALAWRSGESAKLANAAQNISDTCGETTVDLLSCLAAGSAARVATRFPSLFDSRCTLANPPFFATSTEISSSDLAPTANNAQPISDFVNFSKFDGPIRKYFLSGNALDAVSKPANKSNPTAPPSDGTRSTHEPTGPSEESSSTPETKSGTGTSFYFHELRKQQHR